MTVLLSFMKKHILHAVVSRNARLMSTLILDPGPGSQPSGPLSAPHHNHRRHIASHRYRQPRCGNELVGLDFVARSYQII